MIKLAIIMRALSMLVVMMALSACTLRQAINNHVTPSITPDAIVNDTDWQSIAEGLAWRVYVPNNNDIAQMNALRIDPTLYKFKAVYRAGDPLSIIEWGQLEPDAVAIINANFFDPQHQVLGLLVSDGVFFGQSYQGRGGTFAIQNGVVSVRSNILQPYQGEALEQAVQAFPMLVQDGEQAYFNAASDRPSRRTIIGQDSDGNIIILTTPLLGLSLVDLSAYLPTTDLNLVNAFNLDGGGSTMMSIPALDYILPSFDPVPAILAVYRR